MISHATFLRTLTLTVSVHFSPLKLNILNEISPDLLSLTATFEEQQRAYNDELRREFERNGTTEELDISFIPSQCSTPMTDRKSQQWQKQNSPPPIPQPKQYRERPRKVKRPDKKSMKDVRN